jgi:hypothetical protein
VEQLSDAYLAQCEWDARRFSGAYTGTAGTLASHVLRLLAELSRVKGKLAVMSAEREQITQQVHLLAAKYESLR